ncbi:hypothetical protein Tco_0643232 [Tanacetum coccineum]
MAPPLVVLLKVQEIKIERDIEMVVADGVERVGVVLHKVSINMDRIINKNKDIYSMEVVVFSDDDVVVERWLYMMKMVTGRRHRKVSGGIPVTIPEHSGIGAREDAATLTGDVDNLWKIEKLRSGLMKMHIIGSALSSNLLEAVLFDVDGTLCDSDPIRHHCSLRNSSGGLYLKENSAKGT